jgi:hypothetical protein
MTGPGRTAASAQNAPEFHSRELAADKSNRPIGHKVAVADIEA